MPSGSRDPAPVRRLLAACVLIACATWLSAPPCSVASALDDADPLDADAPAPASARPSVTSASDGDGMSLLGVGSGVSRPEASVLVSRTWYDASSASSGGGLPVVREVISRVVKVPGERQPWSGSDWVLRRCGLSFPSQTTYAKPHGLSPLEAYDTYVLNKGGSNPMAAFQEACTGHLWDPGFPFLHNLAPAWAFEKVPDAQRRAADDSEWWGHCNGWAAAAVLLPEPPAELVVSFDRTVRLLRLKKTDPATWGLGDNALKEQAYREETLTGKELRLTRADLVGILSEMGLGASFDGFGPGTGLPSDGTDTGSFGWSDTYRVGTRSEAYEPPRYGGEAPPTSWEEIHWATPYPHNMHLVLLSRIGEQGMPLVGDLDADHRVDNMPIYAYGYRQEYREEGGQRYYYFDTRTTYADYEYDVQKPGTRPGYLDMKFRVRLDAQNRIVGSEWLGSAADTNNRRAHWDFFWFPSGFGSSTKGVNPRVDPATVQELIDLYAK